MASPLYELIPTKFAITPYRRLVKDKLESYSATWELENYPQEYPAVIINGVIHWFANYHGWELSAKNSTHFTLLIPRHRDTWGQDRWTLQLKTKHWGRLAQDKIVPDPYGTSYTKYVQKLAKTELEQRVDSSTFYALKGLQQTLIHEKQGHKNLVEYTKKEFILPK